MDAPRENLYAQLPQKWLIIGTKLFSLHKKLPPKMQ